jgi:hypothetical protein
MVTKNGIVKSLFPNSWLPNLKNQVIFIFSVITHRTLKKEYDENSRLGFGEQDHWGGYQ